jgi:O-antigen ligase
MRTALADTVPSSTAYAAPSRVVGDYFADPVRLFIVAVVVLTLGYGARVDNGSPFQLQFLEPIVGNAFSLLEMLLMAILGLELIRRITIGDFWIERSPVSRRVMIVGVVCCLYPLLHMLVVEGGFRLPLELLYLPAFVATFFLYLFLFRRSELPVMIWMVIIAGSYKFIEGFAVWLRWGISWGLLTSWRDGLLLGMMAVGGVIALLIKSDGDETYARIRRAFIWLLPIATIMFMASMRRSYMLGIAAALPVLIVMLRGRERRAAIILSLLFVVASTGVVLTMGMDFGERVTSSVSDPSKEGSSAYRLLELYNVGMMILERPLTGWPMGTITRNATSIEFDNVSSLMPHNIYMYTLLRAGIWGLLAWGAMFWGVLRMNIRTVRAARRPLDRFASLWLLTTTICVIVGGFTSPVVADRLQLFLAFPFVMGSFLPGAWPSKRGRAADGQRS